MPYPPYDLQALMYELKEAAGGGMVDARDLSRLTTLVLDRLGCTTGGEAFDRLYADWRELPRSTVMSGLRAGHVLAVLPMLRFDQTISDPRREEELRREATEFGPAGDTWQGTIATVSASSGLQQMDDPAQLESEIVRLEDARALLPPGSLQREVLEYHHAGLRVHLAQLTGGEDDFDSAVEDLARFSDSSLFTDEQRLAGAGQLAMFRTHQAMRREDEDALTEQIRALESVLDRFPPGHMDRLGLEAHLANATTALELLRARRTGRMPGADTHPAPASPEEVRRQIADLPRDARIDRLTALGGTRVGQAMMARDYQGALDAQHMLEDALDLLDDPDDVRWIRSAFTLGTSHCSLAVWSVAPHRDRFRHLDQGIAWLRHAWRLAAGPEHPSWGYTGSVLADAHRFSGDAAHLYDPSVKRPHHDEARRIGLESLKAAAWAVLLQSGTAHAAETARRAGEEAVSVARWCLADGAHEDAVRALDAGRGLALHAATVAATVPGMLKALGQDDLADEWRRAGTVPAPGPEGDLTGAPPPPGGPGSRLRRRVLRALAASPLRRRLLDAPSTEEIAGALRALGTTALVYLLPAAEEQPGLKDRLFFGRRPEPGRALVITADGATRVVDLPRLSVSAGPLAAYRAAGTPGRDAGGPPLPDTPSGPAARTDDSRAALERLCDWAGETVMEELLRVLPRGYGRAPSVVLVPMGELGAVPWHAARLPRGRRACELADISYLPSARLLCEVAARPAVPTGQVLVVGNPTRDLHHAGEEAEAIHRTFHPDGELLGPGTATPAAVTDWLGRQHGGLLHLACHGVVRHGERHSAHLALSGGDLAAEVLTEGTARYRHLNLVVLAACRTNVSGHGYDEAYSLSTAFLVAGARSVIGSLWPVPDEATSLLMYMTHYFMRRDGLPPGQALRSAQLWMLDDTRTPPPGMPAHLAARVGRIRGDDLTAWAGFTHLGR
ncbi:CHAT domain-containing protein [Streptomyces sp. NPDC087226]|uniref:CHAT domain-containing protein n=1 Tax=Streptomyces sp. NPDC087226 TaxID=3365771 RepID=UPI00380B2CE0